jgi:tetratricopeptide (TPR) repeat protein
VAIAYKEMVTARVQRFTRAETRRIIGLEERQLHYWERLGLVRPYIRRRQRFYSFGDLVALRAIREVVECRIPPWRLHRALCVLKDSAGGDCPSLEKLRVFAHGREVALIPPGGKAVPIEPLTGQFLFVFPPPPVSVKLRHIPSRTAGEYFEAAISLDDDPASAAEAAMLYQQALAMEPGWVEAHINLGVARYHMGKLHEAAQALGAALRLAPEHPIALFNLGCVMDERGSTGGAIHHFELALRAMPNHADAHFNLAAAYEKSGQPSRAQDHWRAYLRLEPCGQGAGYVRARLQVPDATGYSSGPIPFLRKA